MILSELAYETELLIFTTNRYYKGFTLSLIYHILFEKKNQHPKILYLDYISLFWLLYVLIYLIFSPYVTNCPLISLHARFTNTKS